MARGVPEEGMRAEGGGGNDKRGMMNDEGRKEIQ
jgi:hypothetical protein